MTTIFINQKGSFDTDNHKQHKPNTNPQGLHKGHQDNQKPSQGTVGINANYNQQRMVLSKMKIQMFKEVKLGNYMVKI